MKNTLKEKLEKGQPVIGAFTALKDPYATELLSRLGFDWLVLDGEHSPISLDTMQSMMQSMNGSGCTPIVRPQWNDMVIIKRALDIGAHGILVPWVNNREEAEYAVKACKYPPWGLRGFGPRRAALFDSQYLQTANAEVMVIPQIETREALDNLDDILSVDGIDSCYVGPADLSISLGFGLPNFENADYVAAMDQILAAAKKHNKPAGIFAYYENIDWAIEKGFTLLTVGTADRFLLHGAKMAFEKARSALRM